MAKSKNYNMTFKREAIRLMENRGERSVEQVADDIGVHFSQLYKWRKELGLDGKSAPAERERAAELEAENKRLKRQLEQALKERELLKKSIAFFVKENG